MSDQKICPSDLVSTEERLSLEELSLTPISNAGASEKLCLNQSFNSVNPSYYSFPSPLSGRSPTLPSFRIPKYGYYNLEADPSTALSSPFEFVQHPTTSDRNNSVTRALIQSINYFVGVIIFSIENRKWRFRCYHIVSVLFRLAYSLCPTRCALLAGVGSLYFLLLVWSWYTQPGYLGKVDKSCI